jgi:large subunit ribosomal protein L15
MKLHEIQPTTPLKKRKRVGRGGKRGTYSGKGMKGQKARSGAKLTPLFAGGAPTLTGRGSKVYHKLRGQHNSGDTRNADKVIVNISTLAKKYENGEVVSPETLMEKGIVTKNVSVIKILGNGQTDKKFKFDGVTLSKTVQEQYQM